MNENLYGMFDKVLQSEYSIIEEGSKKTIKLGKNAKYGTMETYSLFDGIIIAFMDINIGTYDNIFFEDDLPSRLLQINHCAKGRYSYAVGDDRIKESYFKLKCLELLLFVSIARETKTESLSLSKKQVDIIENVKNDLINDLESKITIDELSSRYRISKTSLKNCFKEIYGKPIFKWRKEYRLDYASQLIEEGQLNISEISKKVGYSSPSSNFPIASMKSAIFFWPRSEKFVLCPGFISADPLIFLSFSAIQALRMDSNVSAVAM